MEQSDLGKSDDRSPRYLKVVRNAYRHDSDDDNFMEPPSGQPIKKDLRSSRKLTMQALQLTTNGINEMPSTSAIRIRKQLEIPLHQIKALTAKASSMRPSGHPSSPM